LLAQLQELEDESTHEGKELREKVSRLETALKEIKRERVALLSALSENDRKPNAAAETQTEGEVAIPSPPPNPPQIRKHSTMRTTSVS
jgi:hypothetical protein